MGWKTHCNLADQENSQFSYCANGPAAVFFSVLFGLTWIAHTVQAFAYHKKFCWVIVVGSLWECIGLIMRTYATIDQTKSSTASAAQLLTLLAPLWVNAYVYMIFGRMVYYYLPERKVIGFKASSLAKIFIWLDVASFIVQATGGIMDSDFSKQMNTIGLHIYTAGIAVQQFFILCFCYLMYAFHKRMRQGYGDYSRGPQWRALIIAMWVTLFLITVRIIYRLAEFADADNAGNSPLSTNEAPFYILECVPMFFAMLIWNIWHPGRFIVGEDSDFPKKVKMSRKEKALIKQEAKEEAKEQKRRNRNRSSNRRNTNQSDYHLTQSHDEGAMEQGFAPGYGYHS